MVKGFSAKMARQFNEEKEHISDNGLYIPNYVKNSQFTVNKTGDPNKNGESI